MRTFVVGLVVAGILLPWFYYWPDANSKSMPKLLDELAEYNDLDKVLRNASMNDGTVILTTLNEAWARKDGMMDFFLERLRRGNGTRKYLMHLVILAVDAKAMERCKEVHDHCVPIHTQGVDFSGDEKLFRTDVYTKFMWRRTEMLGIILKMGYSFILTDLDIIWFQDPVSRFHSDADFEINCDQFNGNEDDIHNELPNGGFLRAVSNNRTVMLYDLWYGSRFSYPEGTNEQDVLINMKQSPEFKKLGLRIKFLSTEYFSGMCQLSSNMEEVCTIHANCCIGLKGKMEFLRASAEDWDTYTKMNPALRKEHQTIWRGKCM